jgi:hypothetical protein
LCAKKAFERLVASVVNLSRSVYLAHKDRFCLENPASL